MRLRTSLLAFGAAAIGAPLMTEAAVINFHNAYNYAAGTSGPGYSPPLYNSIVYTGQGAFADPGNNSWNGFGGGFPGYDNNGFRLKALNGPNKTSSGGSTPVTLEVVYGFDNGGLPNFADGAGGNTLQGTPAFITGQQAGVNSGSPGAGTATAPRGTFTLHHVPAGVYTLYLYGANYDNDRGTTFVLPGGVAHNAVDSTLNDHTAPGTSITFGEGKNYVIFNNVTPDANGDIAGSYIPNPLDGVGNSNLSGEGSFNGLQLISVPEPGALGLIALGGAAALAKRRRRGDRPSP